MLGGTWREMAGSEACSELGLTGGRVPNVDASTAMPRYRAVHGLMGQRALSACHDCSDGGLAVALAEMAIGGRLGADLDLTAAPAPASLSDLELLYAESQSRLVVTVAAKDQAAFEALFDGQAIGRLGTVAQEPTLTLRRNGAKLCVEALDGLVTAFKATLDW